MRTIQTTIDSERLRVLLQQGRDAPEPSSLVDRWWDLARMESGVDDELADLEGRAADLRRRKERIRGGREVLEGMIVEADRPAKATPDGADS